jgi:sterol desaturase/sphingolipid hydroxylase (fatty acid hydroxylase superfamily)
MAEKRDFRSGQLPGWLNGLLVVGTAATLLWLEKRRPLRRTRESKRRRNLRNLAISALSSAAIRLTEKPVTDVLTRSVMQKRLGLLNTVRLPAAVELALSVVLLDYTLYLWHYLTHRIPFLWRFHLAHHVDLDLDASTALRFHFVEMMLSVPWRAAQVRLLGISPLGLALWQSATLLAIMFHHANVRLPIGFEGRLNQFLVTPRMHGIHHSIVREETGSNWGTIGSWPDRLHGTIRLNVPQQEITIGVSAYQAPAELTIGRILQLPLSVDRPSWQGSPERKALTTARTVLAG